jgi:hypothetical protein
VSSPLLLERTVRIHEALERAGFAHAIGDALALGYHVEEPRATRDIDLNVSADPARPQLLFDALPPSILWTGVDVERALRDGQVRLFWPGPGDVGPPTPVDLFLPQHELHAVVAARAEWVPMLDTHVPILSATDLTIFKALFSRQKDWVDIEALLRFGKVDEAEVLRWLSDVVGSDDERVSRLTALVQEVQRPAKDVPVAAVLFRRRKPRLGE